LIEKIREIIYQNQQSSTIPRSGLRKRDVVKSRRIFCQIVVRKMGYSDADVARFLGINTSAVNRLAVSDELPEAMKYV